MRRPLIALIALFILTDFCVSGFALSPQEAESQQVVLRAVRSNPEEKITIDGRLEELVWQRAEPATDFKQSDPRNGEPATERTEIRIVFNRDTLYIGAQLYDSDPAGLLGNQMVRDGFLASDDRFMWVLDPFNDQRSGYYFEINPGGAMGDAQLVASTSGNVGMTQNRAWDGIWLARVRRHNQGWTVEVEIPFRTLNFNPDGKTWGANFQRTVRRKNEESVWTAWGRDQGLMNLTSAGHIEGISDVSQGHGLDIKPYLIGTYGQAPGVTPPIDSTYKGDGGLDFFYNLTPQLKANLTLNTDFAQTEVDDRQVNLTRFPLFFPEKRDFFLDGAGYFDFSREPGNDITAFFTRRIGLTENGQPQKIDFGTKLGGQIGRYSLGVMHVRTGRERQVLGEDFTVFRPKRQLFRQSYVGMIYTRRATRDSNIPDRHTIGADIQLVTSRFRGNKNLQMSAFYIKTPNGITHGDDYGYGTRISYPNDLWFLRFTAKEMKKHLDPAAGFIQRPDWRELTPLVRFAPRPKNSRLIRQVSMQAFFDHFFDTRGRSTERNYQMQLFDISFQSGDSASVTITPTYQMLPENFRIAPGIVLPEGNEYRYTRYAFRLNMADRRMIAVDLSATLGTFYSGHRRDLSGTLNLRPRRGILAAFTGQFNRVELAEGKFSTKVLRAVINTQFNPFISISNNIQFDSVSRVLGWQSRLRWIVKPGNDIYFVWLNNWLDSGQTFTTLDRNAAAKVVYTYRF
jgi:Domain of unknown function (DUF5916)/Carbohydrate family 9 binding domain-like